MEEKKKKRGRPKVDASLTETVYRESRRQAVNRKYVFDGVGVLMDGGEQIPDNKLLYNLGESKEEFVSRNGILEQIGRMDQQDHASFDDCVYIANLAAAAVKAGAKSREIEEKRYRRLIKEYESEQYDLEPQVEKSKKELETFDQRSVDLRLLLKTVREQTNIKELTPALVNSLIERIEVHNNEKYDGHCHVKVDIYFTVVGMMNVPDEKEIQAMMEEMKNNPKSLKLVS